MDPNDPRNKKAPFPTMKGVAHPQLQQTFQAGHGSKPSQHPQDQYPQGQWPQSGQHSPGQYQAAPQQQGAWPQHVPQQFQQPFTGHQPPAQPSEVGTEPGGAFVFAAFKRAFKQRIEPHEVLPAEKIELEQAGIFAPTFQAFLAWRRSLLFCVAVLLIPILGVHIYEQSKNGELPGAISAIYGLQLTIEVLFTVCTWLLLTKWTNWVVQGKLLLRAWMVFFAAPFVTLLYPFRSVLDEGNAAPGVALQFGILMSVGSMLTLAPKAFALLPGILRASVICKLLFPGSSAPGWLVAMIGPIYAILVYVLMLMPLQISGNGLFVVSIAGLVGAQLYMAKQGMQLATPMNEIEAIDLVKKMRFAYLALNGIGVLFACIAMADLLQQLDMPWSSGINLLMSLVANLLLLTLVATDMLILNLRKADQMNNNPAQHQYRAQYSQSIASFSNQSEHAKR